MTDTQNTVSLQSKPRTSKLVSGNISLRIMLILGFAFIVCVIFFIPIFLPYKPSACIICGTKVKGLATCFLLYAHDFDDLLPPANQWCDLLINETDIYPNTLICPDSDAIVGESAYAMNIEAVGKNLKQLPSDMVLLFETDMGKEGKRNTPISDRPFYAFLKKYDPDWLVRYKDQMVYPNRWNLSGGPEMLTTQYHKDEGCNVLFVDGHSSWIPTNEIPNLHWTADEPASKKSGDVK
jgi:prepilin-type processing-associated H-X9-DG protein